MKKIITLIALTVLNGCASIDQTLFKEKYEKELPYREGETVTVEIRNPSLNENEKTDQWVLSHEETRFGLKGNAQGVVHGVPASGHITPHEFQQLTRSHKAVVKVIKVTRLCSPSQYNTVGGRSDCESGSNFNDEFEFVNWDTSTQVLIDSLTTKKKLAADLQAKEQEKNQKLVAAETARCKPFFDQVVNIRKRLQKMAPGIAQQVAGTSDQNYLKKNQDGSISIHNDQDAKINKLTAPIQRELASLVMNKKYSNCPGNANQSYSENSVESPNPMEESIEDEK